MTDPWPNSPNQHFVRCYYCEKAVVATERGEVTDYDPEHGPPSQVILVECNNCQQGMLFVTEEIDSSSNMWDGLVRVWPEPPRRLSKAIPSALRSEQNEARKCFEAQAYTAAVVMVRRTLEGVCYEHSVKERTLADSLKMMEKSGLLDSRLVEWAQELRVVGNEGAHYTGEQVPREDAQDALAFSEALLDYVYVLAAKFEDFRERRAQRRSATKPESAGG